MDSFTIDCIEISGESEFWRAYIATVRPEGAALFGCNLPAFRDAVTGGGPGWPGECQLYFINTELLRTNAGAFYQGLRSITADSSLVRISLE